MAKQNETRTPQVGDTVGIVDQPGTWVVSGVSHSQKQANLEKIGSQQKTTRRVSWNSLTYRDELDESQNALRVVREATEDS
jgi:hypothetical protein